MISALPAAWPGMMRLASYKGASPCPGLPGAACGDVQALCACKEGCAAISSQGCCSCSPTLTTRRPAGWPSIFTSKNTCRQGGDGWEGHLVWRLSACR